MPSSASATPDLSTLFPACPNCHHQKTQPGSMALHDHRWIVVYTCAVCRHAWNTDRPTRRLDEVHPDRAIAR